MEINANRLLRAAVAVVRSSSVGSLTGPLVVQEPGKRSQLWRMSGSGMLCHEGSSPPQSKPAQPRPIDSSLVLDIAGLAAVSDNRSVTTGKVQLERFLQEGEHGPPTTISYDMLHCPSIVNTPLLPELGVTGVNCTTGQMKPFEC